MPQDKFENENPLAFLGLKEREILGKLAEMDGRTEHEELKWLIRARAFGRLKDLGDDAAPPQISEDNLAEYLHVKSTKVERSPVESGDVSSGAPLHPKPK